MVYNRDKNIKFRLKDLNTRPEFSIWKSWDKKGEEFKDPSGNLMKFPIRDGVLTSDKGEIKQVADIKFMPNKDFKEQYPIYSRKFSAIRQIYFDGTEYGYRFSKTANDKLVSKTNDMQKMGKDPLKAEFEQKLDKGKPANEMYSIDISQIDLPNVEVKSIIITAIPSRDIEILEAIKSVYGKNADEARFVEIMKQNAIEENRAKELFKEYKK